LRWVEINTFNLADGFLTNPYYLGETYIPKYTQAIMKFAELRNVVITSVLGTKCVNDLSFTIDNAIQPQDGFCTGNINLSYPNYRAVSIARGQREIKGNFTSYFYNDELSKIKHYGVYFSLEFTISNGTQAYRIKFPRCKFDGGEATAPNATDPSVIENLTYIATHEPNFYKTDFEIDYIGNVNLKTKNNSPVLLHGWVATRDAILTEEISAMTESKNLSGNIEVVPTDEVLYFAVLSPIDEPAIFKFVNLEDNKEYLASSSFPIVDNTGDPEGEYEINGLKYKANVMVTARDPRDGDDLPPTYCKIERAY
jgi:hypothetical protein